MKKRITNTVKLEEKELRRVRLCDSNTDFKRWEISESQNEMDPGTSNREGNRKINRNPKEIEQKKSDRNRLTLTGMKLGEKLIGSEEKGDGVGIMTQNPAEEMKEELRDEGSSRVLKVI